MDRHGASMVLCDRFGFVWRILTADHLHKSFPTRWEKTGVDNLGPLPRVRIEPVSINSLAHREDAKSAKGRGNEQVLAPLSWRSWRLRGKN
jgi:hypothetical protein